MKKIIVLAVITALNFANCAFGQRPSGDKNRVGTISIAEGQKQIVTGEMSPENWRTDQVGTLQEIKKLQNDQLSVLAQNGEYVLDPNGNQITSFTDSGAWYLVRHADTIVHVFGKEFENTLVKAGDFQTFTDHTTAENGTHFMGKKFVTNKGRTVVLCLMKVEGESPCFNPVSLMLADQPLPTPQPVQPKAEPKVEPATKPAQEYGPASSSADNAEYEEGSTAETVVERTVIRKEIVYETMAMQSCGGSGFYAGGGVGFSASWGPSCGVSYGGYNYNGGLMGGGGGSYVYAPVYNIDNSNVINDNSYWNSQSNVGNTTSWTQTNNQHYSWGTTPTTTTTGGWDGNPGTAPDDNGNTGVGGGTGTAPDDNGNTGWGGNPNGKSHGNPFTAKSSMTKSSNGNTGNGYSGTSNAGYNQTGQTAQGVNQSSRNPFTARPNTASSSNGSSSNFSGTSPSGYNQTGNTSRNINKNNQRPQVKGY